MPITAIIRLRAQTAGKASRSFHCLMHPVLLDRIQHVSPAMSAELHDSLAMSPFSLSPVMGLHKQRMIRANQTCWVRVGILTDALQECFVNTLEQGVWRQPVQFEEQTFQVEEILWGEQEGEAWSGYDSFEALRNGENQAERVAITIHTPLAFRRGDNFYPFPDPSLFFRNILSRWNAFSPYPFPNEIDFSPVSFAAFELATQPYPLRHGAAAVGCVGDLEFLLKRCDPETLACCHTLLRFAFYAGIGVKTTYGMGMVSRPRNCGIGKKHEKT